MSVKVKFSNGYIGTVSEKVAEILESRGEVEIVDVAEDKQPELITDEKPEVPRARRRR